MFALGLTADIVLSNSSLLFHDDYYKTVSGFANFSYYDREGNAYARQEDVIYYTEDGCRFRFRTNGSGIISFAQMSETYNSKYKEDYDPAFVYVDKNGYAVLFHKELEMDDNEWETGTPFYYKSEEGNYYARAFDVYWNADGTIDGMPE